MFTRCPILPRVLPSIRGFTVPKQAKPAKRPHTLNGAVFGPIVGRQNASYGLDADCLPLLFCRFQNLQDFYYALPDAPRIVDVVH